MQHYISFASTSLSCERGDTSHVLAVTFPLHMSSCPHYAAHPAGIQLYGWLYALHRGGSLTVGLLVAGASTTTTELLWLAAAWVSNQQGPVVLQQSSLDLLLGGLIHVCKHKTFVSRIQSAH